MTIFLSLGQVIWHLAIGRLLAFAAPVFALVPFAALIAWERW